MRALFTNFDIFEEDRFYNGWEATKFDGTSEGGKIKAEK